MFLGIVLFFLGYLVWIEAVPPEACFANFRWDDCGLAPEPVMYYWKPGSRCEVGLWRGCLPNINMFHDEYECVATCIFSARAGAEDYHNLNTIGDNSESVEETTAHYDDNVTSTVHNISTHHETVHTGSAVTGHGTHIQPTGTVAAETTAGA